MASSKPPRVLRLEAATYGGVLRGALAETLSAAARILLRLLERRARLRGRHEPA